MGAEETSALLARVREQHSVSSDDGDSRERTMVRWRAADAARNPKLKVWKQDYENWRCIRSHAKAKHPYQADLYVPITLSLVERMFAGLVRRLLPSTDVLSCQPGDRGHDPFACEIVEAFESKKLGYWLSFREEMRRVVKAACVYGTGIMQIGVAASRRFPGQLGTAQYVSLREFWIEPGATSIDTATECHRREFLPRATILAMCTNAETGEPHDGVRREVLQLVDELSPGQIVGAREGGERDTQASIYYERDVLHRGGGHEAGFDDHKEHADQDRYPLLWHYRIDGGFRLLLGSDFVLWDSAEGFWEHGEMPFARLPYIIDPESFYGPSLSESLGTIQREANDLENNLLDTIHLAVSPQLLASASAGLKMSRIRAVPGMVHTVAGDIQQVREIRLTGDTASASAHGAVLQQMAQTAAGIFAAQQGNLQASSPETASATEAIIQLGQAREDVTAAAMQDGMRRAYRQIIAIDGQLADPETVLEVLGANDPVFAQAKPHLLPYVEAYRKGDWSPFDSVMDVQPRQAPAQGNRALRSLQYQNLASLVGQLLPLAQPARQILGMRVEEIVKQFAEANEIEWNRIFLSPDQLAAEQQRSAFEGAVAQANAEIQQLLVSGRIPEPEAGQDHETFIKIYMDSLRRNDELYSDEVVQALVEQTQKRRVLQSFEQEAQQRQATATPQNLGQAPQTVPQQQLLALAG